MLYRNNFNFWLVRLLCFPFSTVLFLVGFVGVFFCNSLVTGTEEEKSSQHIYKLESVLESGEQNAWCLPKLLLKLGE